MDITLNPDYERALIDIVRALPPDRAEQLIDFARFLEAQILSEELFPDGLAEEFKADNAQWDALLESDAGQTVLEELAQGALAEHRAGHTVLMTFDDEDRLVPG